MIGETSAERPPNETGAWPLAENVETRRVALFLPSMVGGGAERVMLDLANDFARRGLLVDLLLVKATGPYLAALSPAVRVIDFGKSRAANSLIPLMRYLRRERPAALLSTLDHVNVLALLARRLTGEEMHVVIREANMLTPVREQAKGLRGRALFVLMRVLYGGADAIITPSWGLAEDLLRNVKLPQDKVRVIYNPAVTPQLSVLAGAPLEHPWFVSGAPPVIVAVGRLNKLKDFPTLIRAFAEVVKARPARLLILGEGEERAALEALRGKLGLEDKVELPGFVDNPFAYMARAGVFVLSSASEGMPNALIQALALGAPVVSTNCQSGPEEILAKGKYGALVPVGDAHALAKAILWALEAPPVPVDRAWLEQFEVAAVTQQYLKALGMDA